jgi:hypothetical protein
MYLKAWCDPNEKDRVLWVYKQNLRPKRKGPKAVAAETAFYASEVEGAENTTEPVIAEIETIAAKHLQKLRTGNINLTDQERAEFATFMGITKWRTKFTRDLMNSNALEIMRQGFEKTLREGKLPDMVAKLEEQSGTKSDVPIEKIEAIAASIADGTTELIQSSKGWSIKTAFERGEEFGNLLSQVPWGLLEAPEGWAFITSDNPLLSADPVARDRGPKGFTFTKAFQFVFPISPKYLLMGDFVNRGDGKARLDAARVRYFNSRHVEEAYEQVFASFRSDKVQELVDKIFSGRQPLIRKLPPGMLDP